MNVNKYITEEEIIVPRFEEKNGFYTTKARSGLMSKIKGKNTKPELALRKAIWALGFRYRTNYNKLPGRPDLVFLKEKVAVFIDGEFWHGHNWEEKKKKIKANRDFWIPKIERNMQRDRVNKVLLENEGYIVIRFWEQDVKKEFENCVREVEEWLIHRRTNP